MVRVLVTRPQPAAARTAAKLVSLGHQPLLLPLAEARHNGTAARNALKLAPAAIAMTSAEAVRVLASLGDDLRPHFHIPVFAVGSATAEAASSLGFQKVIIGPGTGEGLAALVIERAATPLVYLAGTPRSTAFEETLLQAGVPIIVRECYQMIDTDHPDGALAAVFSQGAPDAVLLYSPESARRFFDLPDLRDKAALLGQTRFLCISRAVARIIAPPFRAGTSVSEKPDEASLLALL